MMTCPRCGCTGIHACPGEPIPAWTPETIRELRAVLRRYERHASRNQREGKYIGHARGHHVRGDLLLPGTVRSKQARRVLTRRVLVYAGRHVARVTMLAQAARKL